jgi:hypothetical protein
VYAVSEDQVERVVRVGEPYPERVAVDGVVGVPGFEPPGAVGEPGDDRGLVEPPAAPRDYLLVVRARHRAEGRVLVARPVDERGYVVGADRGAPVQVAQPSVVGTGERVTAAGTGQQEGAAVRQIVDGHRSITIRPPGDLDWLPLL